ncbi:MAG: GNAT family N-acetyltransferase [Gammaproteobacteria bacterium]|nr:GNAT family N-acetyltransferase [Gammaproteobacteria bacterium]
MRIRRLQATDLDSFVELIHRNWDEVLGNFHSAEIVALFRKQMNVPALREQLLSRVLYVAEVDETFVATGALADFHVQRKRKHCISNLFVRPDLQGRGPGALLVAHPLASARRRGIATLHVPSSRVAISFYRRCGFVVDAKQPDARLEMTWMRRAVSDASALSHE